MLTNDGLVFPRLTASKDIAKVRAAFPGIDAQQQETIENLRKEPKTRSFQVNFAVAGSGHRKSLKHSRQV